MQSKNGTFNQINITPLTDIFLVLLVVMIIISPTNQRSVLKIDPPGMGCPEKPIDKSDTIQINLGNNGEVEVEGRRLSSSSGLAIEQELKRLQKSKGTKDIGVNISPGPLTKQQSLVSALDAACGAGIKLVHIDTSSAK